MVVVLKALFVLPVILLLAAGCSGDHLTGMAVLTSDDAKALAEEFIVSSPTFSFDGYGLTLVEAHGSRSTYYLTYKFTSQYAGYGDRTGKSYSMGPVEHEAVLTIRRGEVVGAVLDERYDMLSQSLIDPSVFVCPQDAKECSDGSFVARDPKLDCEFSPCPDEPGYEPVKNYCRPAQREVLSCFEAYRPVCGYFSGGSQDYDNECFACQQEVVVYWMQGRCAGQ